MTASEYQFRVAAILRLFDIDAVANQTGVTYGEKGVELEDQPLLWAVSVLIGRRFDIPEAISGTGPHKLPVRNFPTPGIAPGGVRAGRAPVPVPP